MHITMQAYTDILHATERNHTMSLLLDIPTFDGQDPSKLEDWLMYPETAADILTESHTHLIEAISHGLNHTFLCEALQAEKCWEELKGILQLKLCNANIHIYTSCFKELHQKDNETLGSYVHHFKTVGKACAFDNDTVAICIFIKGLLDAHINAAKIYKKDTQTLSEVIIIAENSM